MDVIIFSFRFVVEEEEGAQIFSHLRSQARELFGLDFGAVGVFEAMFFDVSKQVVPAHQRLGVIA